VFYMKRKLFFFGLISTMLVMFMSGCNNPTNSGEPPAPPDTAALDLAIDTAEAAKIGVQTGTQNQVAAGIKYVSLDQMIAFDAAIATAELVRDTSTNQTAVNSATTTLAAAVQTFIDQIDTNGSKNNDFTKDELILMITSATATKNSVPDGAQSDFPAGTSYVLTADKDTFDTAINAAITVRDNATADQTAIDSAATTLATAVQTFNGQIYTDGTKSSGYTAGQLTTLINTAKAERAGVVTSANGTDVSPGTYWVTTAVLNTFNNAIAAAEGATAATRDAQYSALTTAITTFTNAKRDGTKVEAKTVTITGLPAEANGFKIEVGIFTTKPTSSYDIPVAGGEGTIANGRVTVSLYDLTSSPPTLWAGGTGPYYVGASIGGDDYVTNTAKSFSGNNITVTAADYDSGGNTSKTVTITSLPAAANGSTIRVGIYTTKPTSSNDPYVAGGEGTVTSGNVTVPLYIPGNSPTLWAGGTGPYYVGISIGGDDYVTNTAKSFSGNNLTMTAAEAGYESGGGPGGSITFTGIDSLCNGQYASFRSSDSIPSTGGYYLAGSATSSGITGAQISGGSVAIPVYLVNSAGAITGPYNGNGNAIRIHLNIKPSASFTFAELEENAYTRYTINSLNFTNGSASVKFDFGGPSEGAPKTVTITGLSNYNDSEIAVGIYVNQPTDRNDIPVAYGGWIVANDRATVDLYNISDDSPWTGTDRYYVGFIVGDYAYATRTEQSFSGNSVTVAISECVEMEIGGEPNIPSTGKTVTITGLSDYKGTTIRAGLFATKPTSSNTPPVAGGEGTIQNGSAAVSFLYNISDESSYYVGFTVGDNFYTTKTAKSFSGDTVTVAISECDEVEIGNTPSTGKTVTITGLSDYNGSEIAVGIYATQPTDPYDPPLAGGEGIVKGGSATVSLHDISSSSWSGTGSYYVGFIIGDYTYATKTEKPFDSGNISVTLEEFDKAELEGETPSPPSSGKQKAPGAE
jgi:hypothetical protein